MQKSQEDTDVLNAKGFRGAWTTTVATVVQEWMVKTMTDYIKREDAKDAVINIVGWESIARYVDEMSKHFSTKDNEYYDALMDAEDAIDDLPSADVAPVRHGRWIETSYDEYTCSVCGKNVSDEIFYAIGPEDRESASMGVANYCPNCGAKMDGDADD